MSTYESLSNCGVLPQSCCCSRHASADKDQIVISESQSAAKPRNDGRRIENGLHTPPRTPTLIQSLVSGKQRDVDNFGEPWLGGHRRWSARFQKHFVPADFLDPPEKTHRSSFDITSLRITNQDLSTCAAPSISPPQALFLQQCRRRRRNSAQFSDDISSLEYWSNHCRGAELLGLMGPRSANTHSNSAEMLRARLSRPPLVPSPEKQSIPKGRHGRQSNSSPGNNATVSFVASKKMPTQTPSKKIDKSDYPSYTAPSATATIAVAPTTIIANVDMQPLHPVTLNQMSSFSRDFPENAEFFKHSSPSIVITPPPRQKFADSPRFLEKEDDFDQSNIPDQPSFKHPDLPLPNVLPLKSPDALDHIASREKAPMLLGGGLASPSEVTSVEQLVLPQSEDMGNKSPIGASSIGGSPIRESQTASHAKDEPTVTPKVTNSQANSDETAQTPEKEENKKILARVESTDGIVTKSQSEMPPDISQTLSAANSGVTDIASAPPSSGASPYLDPESLSPETLAAMRATADLERAKDLVRDVKHFLAEEQLVRAFVSAETAVKLCQRSPKPELAELERELKSSSVYSMLSERLHLLQEVISVFGLTQRFDFTTFQLAEDGEEELFLTRDPLMNVRVPLKIYEMSASGKGDNHIAVTPGICFTPRQSQPTPGTSVGSPRTRDSRWRARIFSRRNSKNLSKENLGSACASPRTAEHRRPLRKLFSKGNNREQGNAGGAPGGPGATAGNVNELQTRPDATPSGGRRHLFRYRRRGSKQVLHAQASGGASQDAPTASGDKWVKESGKGMTWAHRIDNVTGRIPLFKILAILNETSMYSNWVPYCKSCNNLKQTSRSSMVLQQISEYPWPVKQKESICFSQGVDALEEFGCVIVASKSVALNATSVVGVSIPKPQKKIPRVNAGDVLFLLFPLEGGAATVVELFANVDVGISPTMRNVVMPVIKTVIIKTVKGFFHKIGVLATNFSSSGYEAAVRKNPAIYDWISGRIRELAAQNRFPNSSSMATLAFEDLGKG